jgi:peptidyl-dipeptidase Dcp
MNPLLKQFVNKYTTVPFSKIKNEHFNPGFKKSIELAKQEIDIIVNNSEPPTFKNTIEALEFSGYYLDRISSIFFNLNAAETTIEIQKIAQEVSPWLSEFSNDIRLNKLLFERIKLIHEQKNSLKLALEQQMLLDKQYKSFTRNGANLNEKEKNKLRQIDQKLSKLSLTFGDNVLAETNAYELHISDKNDLKGLPEGAVEAAQILAGQRNKKGWVFTLDYPSYIPFMTYIDARQLRKKMALAFGARAFKGNSNDNQQIVLEIVNLRHSRAILLGYKSHAHFVLEERMAERPEKVDLFLNDLLTKARPAAKKEFSLLKNLAEKDGISTIEKWDGAYYSEKLKKKLFNFDQEKLKPYFELENVIQGVFMVANKLYDLHFNEVNDIDKYHQDVKTYEVKNSNHKFIAVFYADFFPRKGKQNGAWMTSFKDQWIRNGENSRPHISIVCNFTKPTTTKPSLLNFTEVKTLFHEFGHALHGMLSDTSYPSISGTKVYRDFVELPSQLLENWCYEKEALDLFAKHYKTTEAIPVDLIQKIKETSNFLEGMQTLRQLGFSILDMAWHKQDPSRIKEVKEFEKKTMAEIELYPDMPTNCMSTSFSHIFQGGYSSGYYSYKWAEVLDADAFEYFKETGVFNKKTANKFLVNVLSKGATEKPMDLYKRFRGQEPNSDALLKRAGLKK